MSFALVELLPLNRVSFMMSECGIIVDFRCIGQKGNTNNDNNNNLNYFNDVLYVNIYVFSQITLNRVLFSPPDY